MSRKSSNHSNSIRRGIRSGIGSFFCTPHKNRYLSSDTHLSPKEAIKNDMRRILGDIHVGKKKFDADLKKTSR
jgi:hypothetical protein